MKFHGQVIGAREQDIASMLDKGLGFFAGVTGGGQPFQLARTEPVEEDEFQEWHILSEDWMSSQMACEELEHNLPG